MRMITLFVKIVILNRLRELAAHGSGMTPRQGRMNAGKRDRLDRYPECVYIRYSIMTLRRRKTVAIVADLAPRQGEKV